MLGPEDLLLEELLPRLMDELLLDDEDPLFIEEEDRLTFPLERLLLLLEYPVERVDPVDLLTLLPLGRLLERLYCVFVLAGVVVRVLLRL